MALKIAQSGLKMEHLRLSVERKGYEGLRYLLSEKSNGKPRVTSSKRVIDKVYGFLSK